MFGRTRMLAELFTRREDDEGQHPLLADLNEFAAKERRELACALSMLWDEFHANDKGTGRTVYMLETRRSAYKVREAGGQEKLHYALALELMALYAEVLTKSKPSPAELRLAAVIEQQAGRGTLIRRAGTQTDRQARAA